MKVQEESGLVELCNKQLEPYCRMSSIPRPPTPRILSEDSKDLTERVFSTPSVCRSRALSSASLPCASVKLQEFKRSAGMHMRILKGIPDFVCMCLL